jgi:hypothetical protein
MKIPDFTELLLDGSWFMVGILLFYLISVIKVYILARIQAGILRGTIDEHRPFSGFYKNLSHSFFSEKNLHRLTVSFLTKYKKKNWPEIKNGPINKVLKVLTNITAFLKPFIVFAFVFFVLKMWIASHFLYEPLQITLGEIQKKLFFIHSLPWIKPVIQYKAAIYVVIGIAIIGLFALAKTESMLKKVKGVYSYAFASLSILLNVSFFTVGIAGSISNDHYKLTALLVDIVETHNKIYLYAAETIAAPILDSYLEDKEQFYEKQIDNLRNNAASPKDKSFDSAVINPYFREVEQYIKELQAEYTVDIMSFTPFPPPGDLYLMDPILPKPKEPSTSEGIYVHDKCGLKISPAIQSITVPVKAKPPATVMDNYYDSRIAAIGPEQGYDSYISNKEQWNKEIGSNILADINLVRDKAISRGKVPASSKAQILDLIFSCGLELGLDNLFEAFGLKAQKSLKKIASSLLDIKFKDCFVKATTNLISRITLNRNNDPGMPCSVNQLNDIEKAVIDQQNITWLKDQKTALAKNNQLFIKDKLRREAEIAAETKLLIAQDEARRKAERLEQGRIQKLHTQFFQLENSIIREIESKPLGVPNEYEKTAALYVNNRTNAEERKKIIDKMIAIGTYDPTQSMEDNLRASMEAVNARDNSRIKSQLKDYFIPAAPAGAAVEYRNFLRNNYELVSRNNSVAGIIQEVKSRDGMRGALFENVFSKLCWCCHLPLSYPVCGCNLVR